MDVNTFVWHIIYGKLKPPEISTGRWIAMQLYCPELARVNCGLKEITNFLERDQIGKGGGGW